MAGGGYRMNVPKAVIAVVVAFYIVVVGSADAYILYVLLVFPDTGLGWSELNSGAQTFFVITLAVPFGVAVVALISLAVRHLNDVDAERERLRGN